MTSALHKRLQRLEALVAAQVNTPIWRWQMNPDSDTAAELERMIADGGVAEKDRGRVKIWRWMTNEEAAAHGIVHPEPPAPKPQPQLPAPPELKLLPAPAKPADNTYLQSTVQEDKQQPTFQAKRALTEEQMRKLLEDRDRPFGRPIKYPRAWRCRETPSQVGRMVSCVGSIAGRVKHLRRTHKALRKEDASPSLTRMDRSTKDLGNARLRERTFRRSSLPQGCRKDDSYRNL